MKFQAHTDKLDSYPIFDGFINIITFFLRELIKPKLYYAVILLMFFFQL